MSSCRRCGFELAKKYIWQCPKCCLPTLTTHDYDDPSNVCNGCKKNKSQVSCQLINAICGHWVCEHCFDGATMCRICGRENFNSHLFDSNEQVTAVITHAVNPCKLYRILDSDHDTTITNINEYIKWLMIRAKYGESVSPSIGINKIWHKHILCTKDYAEFCKALGGPFVDHDYEMSHGGVDAVISARRENTFERYKRMFGEYPVAPVWGYQEHIVGRGKRIDISAKTLIMMAIPLEAYENDTISMVLARSGAELGIPPESCIVILGGRILSPDRTCKQHKLKDGTLLTIISNMRGC